MKYRRQQTEYQITLEPEAPAQDAVGWLHGLGADGWDFEPAVEDLGLPDSLPARVLADAEPGR